MLFRSVNCKAIYGLRSSGSEFHQVLADVLWAKGFVPSANDNDAWYRDAEDCYEYVCVYVENLMAILKEPANFFEQVQVEGCWRTFLSLRR